MTDARTRREARKKRRDAQRARKRSADAVAEPPGDDPQRNPLNLEDPWTLLMFASMQVQAAKPDPLAKYRSRQHEPLDFDYLITQFVNNPTPGAAFVVALFAELLDDELKLRCRDALNACSTPLPPWVTALRQVEVYRAVRVSHVLGDFDQLLIGARLRDGQEATCSVLIDHLDDSEITDAAFFVGAIDEALAGLSDPDVTAADMSLADARAWVECGLKQNFIIRDTGTWPGCRPLVQWLVGHLPEGGDIYQPPAWEPGAAKVLFDEFFASAGGKVFDSRDYRYLLRELVESGTTDPWRWSAARVERVLESRLSEGDHPLKVLLDVPDLLRVFIPFAHERSGIREGLTAQTLAALDWRDVDRRSA